MNEIYSPAKSKKIIILTLIIILLLSFFSTGMPFYYLASLIKFNDTALNTLLILIIMVYIYLLFLMIRKKIPYIPFLMVFIISILYSWAQKDFIYTPDSSLSFFVSLIKKSLIFKPFVITFLIFGSYYLIKKKIHYKSSKIAPFFIILTICPFIMTIKSFNIEILKLAVFEISLLFIFLYFLKKNIPLRKNQFDIFILIYITYKLFLIIFHGITFYSIAEFNRILILLSFFYLVLSLPFQENQISFLIKSAIIVSLIISIYGILQFFKIDIYQWVAVRQIVILKATFTRSSSTMAQPTMLASFLIMIIPLTFYKILNTEKKWFYILILFVNCICLFTTFSRAGIPSLLAVSSLILFLQLYNKFRHDFKKRMISILSFIIIISFSISLIILIAGKKRMADMRPKGKRYEMYMSGINMIKKNLIFGVGPGNYKLNFDKYKTENIRSFKQGRIRRVTHAHSEPLEILAENGIIGFLLYLYIFYIFIKLIFKKLWKEKKIYTLTTALSIAVFSVLTQNIFSLELRQYIIPIIFVFLFGILIRKKAAEDE